MNNRYKSLKTILLTVWVLFCATASKAQAIQVFKSGNDGFKSFRIPEIIKAADGSLLAFCEGRVNGAGDFGNVKIVMKKSTDGGKTWGGLKVVVSNDTLQAGNASPVVDTKDPQYKHGRIFLFYNTGNAPEGKVRQGLGVREVWYKTSVDGGEHWSDPVNITLQVHKPLQPQANAGYNFSDDWRAYANGPGHAVQFDAGKYEGRIYVAANHSAGAPQKNYLDGRVHGFYTDDHGKTFKLSDDVSVPGGNESTAAVLTSNKLMINARNQAGNVKARIVSISSNGGQTWDTTYFDHKLPDPVCQGSLLTIGERKGKSILAFCNAADTLKRDNLTLRVSFDEGKSWPFSKLVAKADSGYKGDYVGYSDIIKLDKHKVGVLYESNSYKEIMFSVFKAL